MPREHWERVVDEVEDVEPVAIDKRSRERVDHAPHEPRPKVKRKRRANNDWCFGGKKKARWPWPGRGGFDYVGRDGL